MKYLIALTLLCALFSCRKDPSNCKTDYSESIVGDYEGEREYLDESYAQPVWPYNPSIAYSSDSTTLIMDGWSGWVDEIQMTLHCNEINVPSQNFSGMQTSPGGAVYNVFSFNISGHGTISDEGIFISIKSESNNANSEPSYSEISISKK